MNAIDNLDRQILGYISLHPLASFAEIAAALRCSKLIVDQRLNTLYANGFIYFRDDKAFRLSGKAKDAYSLSYRMDGSDATQSFDWTELYIPKSLD